MQISPSGTRPRGFSQIGYHKVILGDGTIKAGRPETIQGAHALGANANSLGVSLTGNFENEVPTASQINSLVTVLAGWCRQHRLKENSIYGHYNVPGGKTATACPGKNLKSQLAAIKTRVKKQLPVYAVEMKIKDPTLQRLLRKALADDARLSYDEVRELLLATLEDNAVGAQEVKDLQAIVANSKSLDQRSKALIDAFVSLVPPPPTTTSATKNVGGQLTTNFKLSEFACRDGTPVPGAMHADVKELAENLQVLRNEIGKGIHVNSGYRTPKYNKSIGGVSNSQHIVAKAADIRVNGMTPSQVRSKLLTLIESGSIKQGGVGLYKTFVHYDIRGTKARWSKV